MDSESIDNDAQQGAPAQAHWPHRVDWRTGKITYSRDAEFGVRTSGGANESVGMLNEFFQTLQANPPEENKVKKN